jgi:hypothetical protein
MKISRGAMKQKGRLESRQGKEEKSMLSVGFD